MNQSENNTTNVESIRDNLQNVISLLIMLENDLSTLASDEIHLRAVKVIHEILKKVQQELSV